MPFERVQRELFLESDGDTYLGALNALQRRRNGARAHQECRRDQGPDQPRRETSAGTCGFCSNRTIRTRSSGSSAGPSSGLRNLARSPAQQSFHTQLQATPIDVSGLLGTSLFDAYSSVVLTSATLTVASSLRSPDQTSGPEQHARADRALALRLSAPGAALSAALDARPARAGVRAMHAAERTRRVLEITRGRAFCLFTSHAQMRLLYDRMLAELPFPLLLQGSAPRHVLLEQFRDTPNAVLFGTSSFWQGVDVAGEQLSCVIIDRLPFSVPTDPRGQGAHGGHRDSGRQAILRPAGAFGCDRAEAGLRQTDPVVVRPRCADAPRSPHPAATVRAGFFSTPCPPTV